MNFMATKTAEKIQESQGFVLQQAVVEAMANTAALHLQVRIASTNNTIKKKKTLKAQN